MFHLDVESPESAAPIASQIGRRSESLVAVVIDRLPATEAFHYLLSRELEFVARIGSIVKVPFRGRNVRGWVVGFPSQTDVPESKLKPVKAVLGDLAVFDESDLVAARLIARYYVAGLWQVLRHFQPEGLPLVRDGDAKADPPEFAARPPAAPEVELVEVPPSLAVDGFLVDAAAKCAVAGQGAILVDPGTASITAGLLRDKGARVVDLSSCRTPSELRAAWVRVATSHGVVVVGGRSAVFQPVRRLGLIAVSEESNPSLKEQSAPCYSARDVAVLRAGCRGARVILASASPSTEARSWASSARRTPPDVMRAAWPMIEILRRYEEPPTAGALSDMAVRRIRRVLEESERVLLFLNRAGESRATRCGECLRLRRCSECSGALLPEREAQPGEERRLRCGNCSIAEPLICPHCGSAKVKRLGAGTRALAREAGHLFPRAVIEVVDRDSGSTGASASIIVGTEAAFWRVGKVDLVLVVDLDSMLLAPDAYATEYTWALMARAAAHAPPRSEHRSSAGLLVQTYLRDVPFEKELIDGDSLAVAAGVIAERDVQHLPPFARALRISLTGETAPDWAERVSRTARDTGARVLGPDSNGTKARILILSEMPHRDWPKIEPVLGDARSGGCRVRSEVDPSRLG